MVVRFITVGKLEMLNTGGLNAVKTTHIRAHTAIMIMDWSIGLHFFFVTVLFFMLITLYDYSIS